jgi:hypothetical protein
VKFGTLWIGKPSLVEKVVWSSFIHYGHELTVFCYDSKISLPKGVIKAEANDIIEKDKLFYTLSPNKKKYSVSAFADYFRYSMMMKTGLNWTDSDALCLTKNFTNNEYFFANDVSKGSNWIANGTIVAPQKSRLIKYLVTRSEETLLNEDVQLLKWGFMGPALLTEGVDKFKLRKYSVDSKILHPIGFHECHLPFMRRRCEEVKERCKKSKSLHLFTSIVAEKKINKFRLDKGSYLQTKAAEYKLG